MHSSPGFVVPFAMFWGSTSLYNKTIGFGDRGTQKNTLNENDFLSCSFCLQLFLPPRPPLNCKLGLLIHPYEFILEGCLQMI